jgi:hypothetical protein
MLGKGLSYDEASKMDHLYFLNCIGVFVYFVLAAQYEVLLFLYQLFYRYSRCFWFILLCNGTPERYLCSNWIDNAGQLLGRMQLTWC